MILSVYVLAALLLFWTNEGWLNKVIKAVLITALILLVKEL